MKNLTKRQESAIKELEDIMNKKIQERSQINYEITHLRDTIQIIKDTRKEKK